MQGEINVAQVMDEQERIAAWRQRQRRDAEWEALKQWWDARRRVRRARNPQERQEARYLQRQTVRLYGAELRRAWPKWQRVQRELAARRRSQMDGTALNRGMA